MVNDVELIPTLSIVIPAYNEEITIARVLSRIQKSFDPHPITYEVIVVDDGSTDKTARIAKCFGARVISQPNSGYGSALKKGLFQAKGQYLCFLDADNTYPPEAIMPMLELARTFSLVIGSRVSLSRNGLTGIRKFGNQLFALSVAILTGTRTTDVWSGLRVFDNKLLPLVRDLPANLTFTPTMTLKSIFFGFSYIEVFIPYQEREGRSKLSVTKDGWRFIKTLILESISYLVNYSSNHKK
jgi:glycosyltransferase involved in cell wall biosynthesis